MTTVLKIRVEGDPVLRKKSADVDSIGPAERMLVQAMLETMKTAQGIGLAAPQVGINKNFFVADIGEGPYVFFNPRIAETKGQAECEEGCLSVPEQYIKIVRPEKVRVCYQDENAEKHDQWFEGLMARVIQHENDHLMGKLIVDYR